MQVEDASLLDVKPSIINTPLSAAKSSLDFSPLEESPVQKSRDYKKAIKKGERLAKKIRKLSESTKMRKETADKVYVLISFIESREGSDKDITTT